MKKWLRCVWVLCVTVTLYGNANVAKKTGYVVASGLGIGAGAQWYRTLSSKERRSALAYIVTGRGTFLDRIKDPQARSALASLGKAILLSGGALGTWLYTNSLPPHEVAGKQEVTKPVRPKPVQRLVKGGSIDRDLAADLIIEMKYGQTSARDIIQRAIAAGLSEQLTDQLLKKEAHSQAKGECLLQQLSTASVRELQEFVQEVQILQDFHDKAGTARTPGMKSMADIFLDAHFDAYIQARKLKDFLYKNRLETIPHPFEIISFKKDFAALIAQQKKIESKDLRVQQALDAVMAELRASLHAIEQKEAPGSVRQVLRLRGG